MKSYQLHRLFAWAADVWLLLGLTGLAFRVFSLPGAWGTAAFAAVVLLSGLYHLYVAGSVRFLSFGEVAAGRAHIGGAKEWVNPYGETRVGLYLCVAWASFVRMTTVSDSSGIHYSTAIAAISLAIAAVSMPLLGRGHAWALLGVLLYRILEIANNAPPFHFDLSFRIGLTTLLRAYMETFMLAAICIWVARDYSIKRRVVTAAAAA